jgi:glutaconate CoA-transferase subunit B
VPPSSTFGNINTTVIGDYDHPKTRLPGGGGAPEIATSSQEIYITMAQTKRGMVEKIDFYTSFGHGDGGDHRQRLGIDTKGPTLLITDLAIWKPDPDQGVHRGFAASGRDPRARCRRPAAGQ